MASRFAHCGVRLRAGDSLTGLGEAEIAVARDMWQRKWHPDTVKRTDRLRAAQGHLDRLCRLYTSWTQSIYAEKNAAIHTRAVTLRRFLCPALNTDLALQPSCNASRELNAAVRYLLSVTWDDRNQSPAPRSASRRNTAQCQGSLS
jgi:hypothetical protein